MVSQPNIHTHSQRAKLCGINRVNFKINRQISWAVYILFCGSICAFSRSCFCLDYFNVFCGVSSLGVPKWMRPAPSFCWTGWVIRYFSHFQCTKSARSQIKTSFELYIRLHTFLLISSHLQNWLKYKEIFTIYSKINANYSCFISRLCLIIYRSMQMLHAKKRKSRTLRIREVKTCCSRLYI